MKSILLWLFNAFMSLFRRRRNAGGAKLTLWDQMRLAIAMRKKIARRKRMKGHGHHRRSYLPGSGARKYFNRRPGDECQCRMCNNRARMGLARARYAAA